MKVSVVVPTFNSESTINDCLSSLINQTYPPYEIIVVDGGSLDSTVEKIQKYRDIKLNQKIIGAFAQREQRRWQEA